MGANAPGDHFHADGLDDESGDLAVIRGVALGQPHADPDADLGRGKHHDPRDKINDQWR